MSTSLDRDAFSAFDSERRAKILPALRRICGIGLAAYFTFGFLDPMVTSVPLKPLIITRAVYFAVILAVFSLTFVPRATSMAYVLAVAGCLVVGSGCSVLTMMVGGAGHLYHDCMLLTMFGWALFVPWRPKDAVLSFAALVLFYNGLEYWTGTTGPAGVWLTNNFVYMTGLTIGVTNSVISESVSIGGFASQLKLESANIKLRDLDQAKSQFFANITHELRTPLTLILAPLEAMLENAAALGARNIEQLQGCRRNALRLLRLVDDILELSRLESSSLRLKQESVRIVELVTELLRQTESLAQRKHIELTCSFAVHDELEIQCDSAHLERVVLNLLANAIKFTPESGKIEISISATARDVEIAVRDTGVGIAAADLNRIFERFFQADSSNTRRYGGTGIGLAYSKRIVELHGGTIKAESTVGVGTTVRFSVPMHFAVAPNDRERRMINGAAEGERRQPSAGLPEWHEALRVSDEYRLLHVDDAAERRAVPRPVSMAAKPRVLIVEHSADTAHLVTSSLGSDFEPLLAHDAAAALRLAAEQQPAIVVADALLRDQSGADLVIKLRSEPQLGSIPIILLTPPGQDESLKTNLGVVAKVRLLPKPFRPDDLYAAARMLTASGQAAGPLRVDPDVSASLSKAPQILLVEDNAEVALVVTQALANSFRIKTTSRATEALAMAIASPPDIIISDLMMPEMDGIEFCRRLRKDSALANVPFILLTARAGAEEVSAGLEAGADDYIVKPFHGRELTARVNAQLRIRRALATLDERDSRLAAIGQAASSVAHDLNSPLQAIMGHAELALSFAAGNKDAEMLKEDLDAIMEAAKRSQAMTRSVLDFVRSGAEILHREPTDIGQLLDKIARDMEPELKAAGILLDVTLAHDGDMTLPIDRLRLRRTVENLLRNSRDALSSNSASQKGPPTIWLKAYPEGSSVVLRVADNGPGIPTEIRDQLFQPFATSGKAHGTGLGLAIVQNVVLAHDGAISAETAPPERGAAFEIKLPRILVRGAGSELP